MADQPTDRDRFWIVGTLYALAFVASAILAYLGFTRPDDPMKTAGLIGLIATPLLAPLAHGVLRGAGRGGQSQTILGLRTLAETMERNAAHMALSTDARRVINRRHERELLCRAIDEDIASEDWDAAMILVKELAERFGYRVEAEQFRQRVERGRAETLERRVGEGVRELDAMIVRCQWDDARRQAERVTRLFPESPGVEGLRHKVERARERYKEELERRFLHAAEAEPLAEVARGVVGKARQNLGAQFKLAVKDRDWSTAAVLGARVIQEFPNSRIAIEIREVIDDIRERASVTDTAEASRPADSTPASGRA